MAVWIEGNDSCEPCTALLSGKPVRNSISRISVAIELAELWHDQAGLMDLEPCFYWNPKDGSNLRRQSAFIRILGL